MSLFGSLMRDMERDPIFGAHTRAMNQMHQMMDSMMGGMGMGGMGFGGGMGMLEAPPPFGGYRDDMAGNHSRRGHDMMPFGGLGGGMMSPFGGFPNIDQMMRHDGNGHAFSSMQMTSITTGPDGRPQVYQASNQTASAPGGIKETRKAVQDSRSGMKKLAVGRHIGERGHVREREQNVYTGQTVQNEEFIGLEEDQGHHFDREWRDRAYRGGGNYMHSASMPAITGSHARYGEGQGRQRSVGYPSHEEYEVHEPSGPAPSNSGVTIEELPPSDDEQEQPAARGETSNAAQAFSSRRSPLTKIKDKKQKSKRSKKY